MHAARVGPTFQYPATAARQGPPVVAPLVQTTAPDGRVDSDVYPGPVRPGGGQSIGPGRPVEVRGRLLADRQGIARAVQDVGHPRRAVLPEDAPLVEGGGAGAGVAVGGVVLVDDEVVIGLHAVSARPSTVGPAGAEPEGGSRV